MKNVVMIIVSLLLGLLTLGMTFSISGRMNRSVEVHGNLSSAAELTMKQILGEAQEASREEVLAYLVQQLVLDEDAESDLDVQIAYLDIKKGLLSTRVGQKFAYPDGKESSVYHERTMILEQNP